MNPARTLAAFAAGLAVPAALWFGTFFAEAGEPSSISHWNHTIFEKKKAISDATPGPRLVIAGGSGALYGIRARDLSHELGVPVVNAALHAGLGQEYYLHQLKKLVRPGDTIVLALEYQMYMDAADSSVLIDYLVARDPAYFAQLGLRREVRDILAMTPGRLLNPFLVKRHPVAVAPAASLNSETYLDAHGDALGNAAVFKTEALRKSVEAIHPLRIRVDEPAVRRLQEFADWARANRIRLLATHPNTIDFPEYYARPEIQAKLGQVTRAHEIAGIPFVDGWRDTLFETGLFFDTVYHLDSVGATLRTHELAERLTPYARAGRWGAVSEPSLSMHPLEVVDRNFRLWEPLSGFSGVELQPPQGVPVIRMVGASGTMMVHVDRASSARLTGEVRMERGGDLDLVKDGRPLVRWRLAQSRSYQRIDTAVQLAPGDNRFSLAGARPDDTVIACLRFDVEGLLPPAGFGTCEAPRGLNAVDR